MLVVPAIDLKDGKCVRLRHGKADEQTIYSNDPVAMAKHFVAQGAKRLHVIDLDGAFSGEPRNLDIVLKIKRDAGVEVQMGGGIRTAEVAQKVLGAGIDRVILGTIIVEEAGLAKELFDRFPDRVMVALDAKEGKVAIRGWKDDSGFPVDEAFKIVSKLGGKEVIFTDIGRDGTLEGVNLRAVTKVVTQYEVVKIYASGGVTTIDDIKSLKSVGCHGCIVGKALYEGRIQLAEAIRAGN
jgi:phosphoribosylformimino-5-aminoimidazole carboxamide ribotide isomerase